VMFFTKSRMAFVFVLTAVGASLLVNLVLIIAGCLLAIKLMDIAFGAPLPALLKVCAIAIGPGAIGTIIAYFVGGIGGAFAGGGVSVILYYGLFTYLFDLAFSETLMLSTLIWLVRMWLGNIILAMLF